MRALMKTDLIRRYKEIMPYEYDAEIGKFLSSIEGEVVDLVFVAQDAFEANDKNIWLPDELWEEVL